MKNLWILLSLLWLCACAGESSPEEAPQVPELFEADGPYLTVLGIAQDAGFPQADCKKACCQAVWQDPSLEQKVVCLGLSLPKAEQNWMFEATPDFPRQWQALKANGYPLTGIFITHAHIGHYTGLMHLGREAMGAQEVSVHVLPRMRLFLEKNGPWSQLVKLGNIKLFNEAPNNSRMILKGGRVSVRNLQVPHRDEFSETAAFIIEGPKHSALFVPDIDKWGEWNTAVVDLIKEVDYAFLDGTFYANGEIPGRDMSEIPHPFVEESLELFKDLSPEEKAGIYFIHFNHTNPLMDPESKAARELLKQGYPLVREGMKLPL